MEKLGSQDISDQQHSVQILNRMTHLFWNFNNVLQKLTRGIRITNTSSGLKNKIMGPLGQKNGEEAVMTQSFLKQINHTLSASYVSKGGQAEAGGNAAILQQSSYLFTSFKDSKPNEFTLGTSHWFNFKWNILICSTVWGINDPFKYTF